MSMYNTGLHVQSADVSGASAGIDDVVASGTLLENSVFEGNRWCGIMMRNNAGPNVVRNNVSLNNYVRSTPCDAFQEGSFCTFGKGIRSEVGWARFRTITSDLTWAVPRIESASIGRSDETWRGRAGAVEAKSAIGRSRSMGAGYVLAERSPWLAYPRRW